MKARRWLRWLAWLVPGGRRREWLREWSAELAYLREGRRAGGVARLSVSALEDALMLRMRGVGSGGWTRDLRYALRSLRRSPVFSLIVIATLALGIGANAAVFSAVRGVLLRPLPYEQPEELAAVGLAFGQGDELRPIAASGPEFLDLRSEATAFRDLVGFYLSDVNLGGVEAPLRVSAAVVTPNVLDVLGIDPVLGRGFAPGEDLAGAADVVVLSHGLWLRAFGGDPAIVGREVLVNGRPADVIGVLPPAYRFPGGEAELLRNLTLDPANPGGRSSHWISMFARLESGLTAEGAQRRTDELLARWEEVYPGRHQPGEGHPVQVVGLRDAVVGEAETPLLLLLGAVGVVLLVACVNIANLLIVRGEDRQRELSVRAAMGAGRTTLLRQLLVENVLLAAGGGLAGLGLAAAGVGLLPSLPALELPRLDAVGVDPLVLGFSAALTLAAGILFGLLPAWSASKGDIAAVLRTEGRTATAGRRRVGVRRLLVVAEVAMAVVLLAGAGVLGRGFMRLMEVDPGFDPTGVVTMDFSLNSALYSGPEAAAFHAELGRRLESLPGVEAAGAVRTLPLRGIGGWETLKLIGRTLTEDSDWTVQYQVVSPGFFEALRIPSHEGRTFTPSDDAAAPPVAVLNRAAARQLFPDRDAIGQRIQVGNFPDNPNPVLTVVGVVGDIRQIGLDSQPTPQLYVPRQQAGAIYGGLGTRFATLAVRGTLDLATTMRFVRDLLRDMDPRLPVANVQTLQAELDRSTGERRLLAGLMGAFSATALLLGALGLYGLLAYIVTQRRHEIGIRLTLGARRGRVLRSVVGEALGLVVVGSLIGVSLALLAGDLLEGLAFQVSTRDPVALVGAPVLLLFVALLAAVPPAHRAARIDPAIALREG